MQLAEAALYVLLWKDLQDKILNEETCSRKTHISMVSFI